MWYLNLGYSGKYSEVPLVYGRISEVEMDFCMN